jgi:hypothetical protein
MCTQVFPVGDWISPASRVFMARLGAEPGAGSGTDPVLHLGKGASEPAVRLPHPVQRGLAGAPDDARQIAPAIRPVLGCSTIPCRLAGPLDSWALATGLLQRWLDGGAAT